VDEPTVGKGTGKPIGRRVVLGILGLGAVGVVVGDGVQRGIDHALSPLQSTGVGKLVPGGGSWTFYTVTNGFPAAPPDYRLQVGGLVRRPMALTVDELRRLPATHLTRNWQCVTGWQVADVHWVGVRLTDLFARAGMHPGVKGFRFWSFDGVYTETLTLEQAHQSGAIIAYSMLGKPVTRAHGGPVRLYVPGMFGYKSIKWLQRVEAVSALPEGYWEHYGYPIDGWIDGRPPSV